MKNFNIGDIEVKISKRENYYIFCAIKKIGKVVNTFTSIAKTKSEIIAKINENIKSFDAMPIDLTPILSAIDKNKEKNIIRKK